MCVGIAARFLLSISGRDEERTPQVLARAWDGGALPAPLREALVQDARALPGVLEALSR